MGITGRLVHADGQEEVPVMGGEVWEEWTGQTMRAQTGGRGRRTNGQPKKEQYRGELNSGVWTETKFMTRGERLVGLEKKKPWLLLAVVLSHFYPLLLGGVLK